MTNHSWNNNDTQSVILSQNSKLSPQKGRENYFSTGNNSSRHSLASANNLFIISKAYIEPQSFNNVENVLLQRDFIID